MNYFEVFELVIEGKLRPHYFKDDGIKLKEILDHFEYDISESEIIFEEICKTKKFVAYLKDKKDTKGIKIVVNEEFEDLIDLDIPPPESRKSELYLEFLEIEYFRNKALINKFIKKTPTNEYKHFGIDKIQHCKRLVKSLRTYKKLIIKDPKTSYENSNYFVISITDTFLTRLIYYLLENFEPYLKKNFIENTIIFLTTEITETIKKVEMGFFNCKFEKDYPEYKGKKVFVYPWSDSTFNKIKNEILNLDLEVQIAKYEEIQLYLKRAILSNRFLDSDKNFEKRLIPLIKNEIELLKSKNDMCSKNEQIKKLKRIENRTLELLLEPYIKKYQLVKDQELSGKIVKKICTDLINDNWDAKKKSIGTKLREMGYKKNIYR